MKRLLSVGLIMLCLSLPVFAGHILAGGRSEWCKCGSVPECVCDEGELPQAQRTQQPLAADLGSETLLVLALLLLALRYKA